MLTLVDRETKQAKSIIVDDLKKSTLIPILRENIAAEATVYIDEADQYKGPGSEFAGHDFTRHGAGEYVRKEAHQSPTETLVE